MSKMHKKKTKFTRKHFVILVVCIITGFFLGYSYNLSKDDQNKKLNMFLEQEDSYREQLIEQQERNKKLNEELHVLQDKIRGYEKNVASNEEELKQLLDEAEQLRLLLGEVPAQGEGVKVILQDGAYDPNETNPNDYIVHESHIFKVLNELKISGAEAIAINGQRLNENSYIRCNGPVITVDGNQYPAPFVIEAIGHPENLMKSLKITGGVLDQLLNDQIIVTVEKMKYIQMPSVNDKSS